MNVLDKSIRVVALAVAALVVGGALYAADSSSDAAYGAALAGAEGVPTAQASQIVLAPVRVDVVGKRNARTAA
jgi:hypothetical protein